MTKRKLTPEEIARFERNKRFTTDNDEGLTQFNRGNQLEEFQTAECRPWIEMCAAVDKRGDLLPLLDLLQAQGVLSAEALPFVRDLFERHGLLQGIRGNLKRTPLYELSKDEVILVMACEDVRMLAHGGRVSDDIEPPLDAERFAPGQEIASPRRMNVDNAIERVAKQYGLHVSTLTAAYNGQHGGMRRVKKRLTKRRANKRNR